MFDASAKENGDGGEIVVEDIANPESITSVAGSI